MAIPWPPPMQAEPMPYFWSCCRSLCTRCAVILEHYSMQSKDDDKITAHPKIFFILDTSVVPVQDSWTTNNNKIIAFLNISQQRKIVCRQNFCRLRCFVSRSESTRCHWRVSAEIKFEIRWLNLLDFLCMSRRYY